MHNETDRWTDEKRNQKFNLEKKNKPENRIGIKTTCFNFGSGFSFFFLFTCSDFFCVNFFSVFLFKFPI